MTRQQAYVMKGAGQLFLSHEALEVLGCVKGGLSPKPMVETEGGISELGSEDDKRFECPIRSLLPGRRDEILFKSIEENIDSLPQSWQHFSALCGTGEGRSG